MTDINNSAPYQGFTGISDAMKHERLNTKEENEEISVTREVVNGWIANAKKFAAAKSERLANKHKSS
jgi:hypothetical protein